MTLRITLKAGEQVIVNGAVLRAVGRTSLRIENRAAILRGGDLMSAADATTPARRLYHACIAAYIDPDGGAGLYDRIVAGLSEVVTSLPNGPALAAATSFARHLATSDHYKALADCRRLMALEAADAAIADGEARP